MSNILGVLPDIVINMDDVATDFGTALGAVVLVIVGIFGAYLVVLKGIRWMSSSKTLDDKYAKMYNYHLAQGHSTRIAKQKIRQYQESEDHALPF